MPRAPRCLVPDTDAEPLLLDAAARHHLGRVLRLRPDDAYGIVDGRGGLLDARWSAETARGGPALVTARHPRAAAPRDGVSLAVAPPRAARLEWLVEKATELDVAALHLLAVRFARAEPPPRLERLQRKADEALLQCGRLHRLALRPRTALADVLAEHRGHAVWLATPDAGPTDAQHLAAPRERDAARPLLVLVGPEGGFAPEEIDAARAAGALAVTIGRTILRVETAAVALAARAARWSVRG